MPNPKEHSKIVIAVSGSGRSLENFIQLQNTNDYSYQVAGVISSNAKCRALDIAAKVGLPIFVASFAPDKLGETARKLSGWLDSINPKLVVLAGFIKKMPIPKEWVNKMINIHPALLPKYGGQGMFGLNVHQTILKAGEKESGASVHYINDVYDEGKIIAQAKVNIETCTNAQAIADKVFAIECKLYPRVVTELLNGSLPLVKGFKSYEF